MMQKELTLRTIGFFASLLLTLAAYLIITNPDYFYLKTNAAIITILVLAALQFIVQFLFFINIWREKKTLWNVGVFVSTLSIIFIIIVGSIWIMHHLDYNMMPKTH